MKKTTLIIAAATVLMAVGCKEDKIDDNKKEDILVESVVLDNSVSDGYTLVEGSTLDISGKVSVTPENAVDLDRIYSSSDEAVATVDEEGVITAIKEGQSTITVEVGSRGRKAEFTLTVAKKVIAVESVVLDEAVRGGIELELGETFELASKVTVLPENATNKAVTYSSSDEAKVTVSNDGVITAVAEGSATITVTADGKDASFTVNVKPAPKVNIETIAFGADTPTKFTTDLPVDLLPHLEIIPAENEDAVVFASSDPNVVMVDENGLMTIKGVGTATVTASAASDSGKKAELKVSIASIEYARFIDREGEQREYLMTMTCSQDPLAKGGMLDGRNNSLHAMLDGKSIVHRAKGTGYQYSDDEAETNGTAFGIVVPGKSTGGVDLSKADKANHEIYFIIDLKSEKTVNYFRINNISDHEDDNTVRFKIFSEILGSNDGETFTSIVKDFNFEDYQTIVTGNVPNSTKKTYQRETANIKFTESPAKYRYLKFVTKGNTCFGAAPKGAGTTAQIDEFYLGYDPSLSSTVE